MTDDTAAEGGALIGVKTVTSEFATSYMTNHVDKIPVVKVLEPVLVGIMGVGVTVEVHRQRILHTVLITSVLRNIQYTCNEGLKGTYSILLLVEHERCDSPSSVGAVIGLATDTDSGAASAILILGAGNSASRHGHDRVVDESGSSQSG